MPESAVPSPTAPTRTRRLPSVATVPATTAAPEAFEIARDSPVIINHHAAGRDSILPALSSGLCQRQFLSAARSDGRAERPRRIIVLRARRERNSRTFIVDKGTPNLCAASLAGSPSRSQSSMAVRRGPGSFNSASERIFRCSTRAHCSSGLGSSEGGSIPGATSSSPVNTGSSGNSRRHFRLRNRIGDELMAIWRPHCPPHRSSIS